MHNQLKLISLSDNSKQTYGYHAGTYITVVTILQAFSSYSVKILRPAIESGHVWSNIIITSRQPA